MLSDADRSLAEGDPEIPGLRTLLDDDALLQCLDAGSGEFDQAQLRCDYLRYKPGVNCIARFRVRTGAGEALGYAKAFSHRSEDKFRKSMAQVADEDLPPPGISLSERNLVVIRMLPNDAQLRSLARLGDAGDRKNLLARLFKGLEGWESADCQVLSYKPERRLAARFSNASGDRAAVKFYRANEFERIRKYRKRLVDGGDVPVARWLGGSKAHYALVFDWLEGRPLSEFDAAERESALESTGRALARFHLCEQPGLGKRSRGEATRKLLDVTQVLEGFLPELREPATRLATKVGRWHRRQEREKVPVHGDFDATQAVVGESGTMLIDSDHAHLGNAVSDLGCFRAKAELMSILEPRRAPDPALAMEHLIGGYRGVREDAKLEHVPAYTAWHLMHLLHAPFRARARDWPERTLELFQKCREIWGEQ